MSYHSTTWQTGDVVTADKLNNIEQGIIALDTALNELPNITEPQMGKAVFVGDSIGQGYNNNDYSFVNVLQEDGFFSSITKNCVAGNTTFQMYQRLSEVQTEVEAADIVYIETEGNDINGLVSGSYTAGQLATAARTAIGAIRSVNPTCIIIWMPLTFCHFDKVGGTNANYYKEWANAMYPVFADLAVSILPIYDMLTFDFAVSDKRHPNNAGHKMIANLVKQNPFGYTNFPISYT